MPVELITDFERWKAFAEPWNLLTRGVPFRGWEWLSTWWRHYGGDRELAVLVVLDDRGMLIGSAPWYVESVGSRGRVLRSLGAGEVCSDYPTVLSTADYQHQVSVAVGEWLADAGAGLRWDVLELECVPEGDAAIQQLIERLQQSGCTLMKSPSLNLWSIPLPPTWPEYLTQLSKSHRKQINRLMREQWDTGRARLIHVCENLPLQRGMELLVDLHQRRWNLAGQPGSFASPRFKSFLTEVAEQLHGRQLLQLSVLELDGRPAAVDFHIVSADVNYVYQGGVDPELTHESPGKLLSALLIKAAIAAGRKSFDFLRGDEEYKPHFRAIPLRTNNLYVIPRRTVARFRYSLWLTGLAMRNLVRSSMTLTSRSRTERNVLE